ncbi:envelope integrity protein Cei [Nakamurella flavida]|uniref:Envelope integrity protein Cei n=1 Tax=Nakamurella flavida TaxID=363630 RepID=A0A939C6S1_9ACTN|nr:envelope integrity protein Cei [Nakamurella flavida]MBM9477452.1 envelope integrity protein Cei [Nakamurella flavida]MDP9777385.1 hypothetical protein [Nakamurella flavida]
MSVDTAPERYRRRRYWPVLSVVAVLLLGAGIVWFQALRPDPSQSRSCNTPGAAPVTTADTTRSAASSTAASEPAAETTASSTPSTPAAPTTLGVFTDASTLAGIRPADPTTIGLSVFNASTVRGQAKAVTDELRAAGFASIRTSGNDPLYVASDLRCVGEIRYGPAGAAAARTVLILAPCAQLVLDGRVDDSVDLALGARYLYAPVTDEVKAELRTIQEAATPPAVIEGQTAAPRPQATIPPLPQATCAT